MNIKPTDVQVNASFKYLLASRVLRSVALSFVTLSLPLYLVFMLHQNLISIGLIYFGIILFTSVTSFLFGVASDSIGYARTILIGEILPLIGLGGLVLSTFTIGTSMSAELIVLSAMLAGVSGVGGMRGSFSSGQMALIANNWKNGKDRVNRMARIITAASIASIIGGFMLVLQGMLTGTLQSGFGALVASTISYRYFFIISTVLIGLSMFCLFFVKEAWRTRKKKVSMKRESISYTLRVMSSQMLAGIGLGLALPILPALVAESFALSASAASQYIGYVFGIGYILIAISSFYVSKAINKQSINILKVATIARLSQGVLLVVMALVIAFLSSSATIGLIALGAVYVIYSSLIGVGAPMRQAINVGGIHANDYGTASAAMGASIQLPQASSGAAGFLTEAISSFISLPLAIGGVFVMASGVVYWKFLKNKQKKSPK